ncbi:hypothetical protein RN001_006101 [Aquatica leii]|uniref:Ionotropic glutamate receptor C-terminal domain-containing protein n=1 Tax=Aquatica leii TaxID=1421715 RepID=A0AAN7SIE6_9COLE|nr:hypothetical protein RN001_006101 [Aquatica leii]
MLKTYVFVVVAVVSVATHMLNTEQEVERVKICVRQTIKNIFDENDNLLFLFDDADSFIFPDYVDNPSMINGDMEKTSKILNISIGHKQNFIIYTENYESMDSMLIKLFRTKLGFNNTVPTRKMLVVIPNISEDDLVKMFYRLWKYEISKVVVLTYDLNITGSATLMTGDPLVEPNQCGRSVKLIVTHGCSDVKVITFPKVLQKYNNCNITYLSCTNERDCSEDSGKSPIIGMKIVAIIVDFFNMTLNMKYDNNPTMRLDQYVLRLTEMNQCRYVVPDPKRIPAIETLKLVFKRAVWLLILLTFILISFSWWLIEKFKHLDNKPDLVLYFLEVYSMTITASTSTLRLFWSFRYLFITYVFYSIHIQAVFTGKLVTLLTVPQYEKPIRSLEELANSNYLILIPKTFLNLLNFTDANSIYKTIKTKLISYSDKEVLNILQNKNMSNNYTIFIDEETIEEYTRTKNISYNYFIDDSYSGGMKLAFATRAGSTTTISFNEVITRLTESGIINKFNNDFDYTNKNRSMLIAENKVLDIDDLHPAFVFWGIGLFFATVGFVLEHLVNVAKQKYLNRN